MARSRREPEPEEPDDDDEMDEGLLARDFVMARMLGVIASLDAAKQAMLDAASMFVSPDDDKKGAKRTEAFDVAVTATTCALRGLEEILEGEALDEVDWKAGEPYDEGDEDDEGTD